LVYEDSVFSTKHCGPKQYTMENALWGLVVSVKMQVSHYYAIVEGWNCNMLHFCERVLSAKRQSRCLAYHRALQ
jgi:hypothetical protein